MKVIGCDVGGSFTDIIMVDTDTGEQVVHKVQSTPHSQDIAVIQGIREILEDNGISPVEVSLVVHGTTVATNAMLQRKGARVCLVTTAGLEDLLEIGRQNREEIYSLQATRPQPLVGREHRIGVHERLDAQGNVIEVLNDDEVERIVSLLQKKKPDAVAVSLLFSYCNSEHEMMLLDRIKQEMKSYAVASSQVLPEFREFERTSTTVLEAYLGPLVLGYLRNLDTSLRQLCPKSKLLIMQSNGGTIHSSRASGRAIGLAISGLAGGVMGGWYIASQSGVKQAITVDMGGTSCDISAIVGKVVVKPDNEVGGLPLRVPSVDVKTIGAGGGSIAWVDDAGVLHVGPQSAGADPGPAAYDKQGLKATVTDANLLLGRLNPQFFLGGRVQLSVDCSRTAVSRLSRKIGKTVNEVALGIIRISTSNMMQAIREVTVERGHDPRQFILVPFGGAGPTQAVDIAEALNINTIIVPPFPGITSALGLVCADLRVDLMRSVLTTDSEMEAKEVTSALSELTEESKHRLIEQGAGKQHITCEWSIDMRYAGQSHELSIRLPQRQRELLSASRHLFESEHERIYGYRMKRRAVEWVTVRVVARAKQVDLKPYRYDPLEVMNPHSQRDVILEDSSRARAEVYRREQLSVKQQINGPAIIEQVDSTTYLGPDWSAEQRRDGTLLVRRSQGK